MIDLHSHLLPELDDGASDLAMSLDMARLAVAGGVTTMACTPHIMPGVWANAGPRIRERQDWLQERLDEAGIPLRLVAGSDNHIAPDMAKTLKSGTLLTLADSRYVLVEPPHHVAPVRLHDFLFELLTAGFVPILTHPERLSWIERHYDDVVRCAEIGVWMQVTAGSLNGRFGRRAQYWGERMLDEGVVHILASDAHNVSSRPPDMAEGAAAAARIVGEAEARNLVVTRPTAIIENVPPSAVQPLPQPRRDRPGRDGSARGPTGSGRAAPKTGGVLGSLKTFVSRITSRRD